MSRDDIIKKVADIVGPKHKVDLKNYDVLILVDIFKVGLSLSLYLLPLFLFAALGDTGDKARLQPAIVCVP
jgi:hypothetical protein